MFEVVGVLKLIAVVTEGEAFSLLLVLEVGVRLVLARRGVGGVLAVEEFAAIAHPDARLPAADRRWQVVTNGLGVALTAREARGLGEGPVILGRGSVGRMVEHLLRGLDSPCDVH